jgi:hypothetical protein
MILSPALTSSKQAARYPKTLGGYDRFPGTLGRGGGLPTGQAPRRSLDLLTAVSGVGHVPAGAGLLNDLRARSR